MRSRFDEMLKKLKDNLIVMGSLCEECITSAAYALIIGEEKFIEQAVSLEKEIDSSESFIRHLCMDILLRQQPVAKDLCLVSTAMKLIVDMERIGDMGRDIAELSPFFHMAKDLNQNTKMVKHIAKMTEEVCAMLKSSILSFVKEDINLAKEAVLLDNNVDELFFKIKDDLVLLICDKKDAGKDILETLMIAKYLERIGDHSVNIAESVIELLE
ncbi:MAG: phosphate signaling complex protein PhoU [Treponema sp.]|nr:phosphate signaling complex protein PhoU [Treponema sp.]